ncbi:PREDICTED: uncharacterized protein C19orf57 homolog [Condylura cristata]|uniref:uncharacterized protein C19orf57 homolog n=1 Tax=Condylura cristata TaxID=143302 RepID=UPI000642DCED|nr:PREDICTED: uncharacterized protein C19orf57 homolog [Condylura cristata]
MNKAFSLETQAEPNAQQAGSQLQEEPPKPIVQEAREPGDQLQADSIHLQYSDQSSETPVLSSRDSQPGISPDISLERETVPSVSERINQNQLSESRSNTPDGRSGESAWVPGGHSQKMHLSNPDAEEKLEQGSPTKGNAPQGARADPCEGPQEEEEPRAVAQGLPDAMHIPNRAGREAEQNFSNPTCSSPRSVVVTDVNTEPAGSEQRALEAAEPDGQTKGRIPDEEDRGALLNCILLTGKNSEGRGESERGTEPLGDLMGGPEVTMPLVQGIQESTVGAEHPNPPASEMGPGTDQRQVSGLDQEGLGGDLPLLLQPSAEKAAELGIQTHEQDLKGLSLPLQASTLPVHSVVNGLPWQTSTFQGSPDASAGQPKHPPDSADQTAWGASLAQELDFLPDSQIWEALEAPDFEAPPEQLLSVGPLWPSASTPADGGSLDETQQRTHMGIKACGAPNLEDATDIVQGLVIELSNLNRIIMSAHRNLEVFKHSSYYKAKSSRKASVPFTSLETGNPHGGLSWKDF